MKNEPRPDVHYSLQYNKKQYKQYLNEEHFNFAKKCINISHIFYIILISLFYRNYQECRRDLRVPWKYQ